MSLIPPADNPLLMYSSESVAYGTRYLMAFNPLSLKRSSGFNTVPYNPLTGSNTSCNKKMVPASKSYNLSFGS